MSSKTPQVDLTASAAAALPASRWRRLLGDRGGAVAIYFVLTMIPLMVAVGAAVDISRAYVVKQRLCYALDAAGLAVGSSNGTPEQLNGVLVSFFNANYPTAEIGVPATPSLSIVGSVITVAAEATVDTTLMKVVGVGSTTVGCSAEITKSSQSIEVAMVLDITGSMAGTRIADLKVAASDLVDLVVQDVQTPHYTKMALVPYSNGVNVGEHAASVRGAVPAAKAVTNIAWFKASAKNISGATRANPVVVTSTGHGFVTGDIVRITGVSGMTQLNNNVYTVGTTTANTFQLSGVNGTGFNNYSSGGQARPCHTTGCAPVVTATNHGFNTNDRVRLTDVVGTTQVNDTTYQITRLTSDTFALAGISPFSPTAFSNYTSGGNAWCTTAGCEFFFFNNNAGGTRTHRISTCATERIGAEAYSDAAPSTSPIGRQYPPTSGNVCPTATITPMSSDKTMLKNTINAYTVAGSTAGHIGLAWGWYMIAPTFSYLWPASSQPGAYGADKLVKVLILMTDGAFNTPYCNGVIAADAGSGSGSNSDHINCNATNGNPFTQAATLCTAVKAKGILLYTVGFDIGDSVEAQQVLANCATDPSFAYLPATGAELKNSFKSIAQSISNLRLSK